MKYENNHHAFRGIAPPKLQASEFHRCCTSIRASIFSLVAAFSFAQACPAQSVPAPAIHAMPPAIVIGFVGGFVQHDNLIHSEVQLAARLRKDYPVGVNVETFESYHGERAQKHIQRLLDTNHDGTLTPEEKHNARIIIYGHSWGGSEAISLARKLGKIGIPVLLTIQVDSIPRFRQNDTVIPANVAQAANFYQPDGHMHGESRIRAADSTRTNIIGNFRYDYKGTPYNCSEYPWYDRIFGKAHTQIECDPKVWEKAESLIRSDLPPPTSKASTP